MQNEIRSSLGKRRQNLKKNHSERVSQQQQLQIKETFLELSSGEAWLKAYGGDILQYLQAFYPPEMTEKKIKNWTEKTKLEINFTKKLTAYLDNPGAGEFYVDGSLRDQIKEKLQTLKGEFTKIEAIQRLQSTRDAEQNGERQKIKMTLAEIADQEEVLKDDPARETTLNAKIADIVQRKGLSERFTLHTQHTNKINALYRSFLDEKDVPVLEVAKVGRFSIVELVAQQHLVAESDCQNHCVGTATSYRNNVKRWTTKIFSIRTNERNPLSPETKTRYTVEYDTVSKQLRQFKGYKNSSIVDMLSQTWNSHKQELIDILVELAKDYPINGVDSDLQALIPSGSVLRKDGKIAPLPDTTAIINKYLTGNEMLIGDKPKLTLDQNYTYDQVSKLCAYPNLRLDLTNVAPAVKAQLSYILGKVIDTSLSENYTSVYPKLRKLDHPLTTASHTIFYDLEKKEISSMENYKWNERQRKAASYEFLRANGMDTSENRKLIEAVKFGSNYVEVWGIKFSNEKLKPQNSKRKAKNKYDVYPSSTKGLRKTEYNGQEEYYYDLDAYKAECKTQNKTPLMKEDFEEALKSLPGEYKERNWYEGGKILSLLLWMSMSGYVGSDGFRWGRGWYGCLGSASSSGSGRRHYGWDEARGRLDSDDADIAFPSLFRL